MIAPDPTALRLAALRRYDILDTPPEQAFDEIVQLAAEICDTPIGLVSLVETDRQWFKAVIGLDVRQTPIGSSICAQVMPEGGVVVVPDTRADPRMIRNPLVTAEPGLRFYAGAVLTDEQGTAFGTLCVLDRAPRHAGLTPRQSSALAKLGRQVVAQMELRVVARELREREARLHALTEALPQLIWAGGADGAIDYYNRQWYDYTGVAPGTTDGDGWSAVLHPDDVAETRLRWRHAIATCEPYETEYRLRAADGVFRWFLGRAVPVRDFATGAVIRWFGSCTDIEAVVRARAIERDSRAVLESLVVERTSELAATNARLIVEAAQRARAEDALRQAQKMEALGQLTGGIAHDFNNLLTGILGALELVRSRLAAGKAAEVDRFLLGAMMAANRASALTQRLLTFARRQPLDARPTDVRGLVASMGELIRRTVGEAIDMALIQPDRLWPALCDANQLESALLNLAINGRDAMPRGGTLSIETADTVLDGAYAQTQVGLAPGEYVRIAVSDTGTGMAPEVAARVMEPFFTTKPAGQGTGLGMSMLYGFVAQSGGHVRLSSEPGRGTRVEIYLPRAQSAAEATATDLPVASLAARERRPAGLATVLIVEDDATIRMLVREQLAEGGYAALEAADGRAALDIVEATAQIDLLVTDIGLPGMDGRVLAARAKAVHPELKVLFITGYGECAAPEGTPMDLPPGMRMIGKPFSLSDLEEQVRALEA